MNRFGALLVGVAALAFPTVVPAAAPVPMKHKILVTDIGVSKLNYIDLANPTQKWSADVYARDLQLIGNDRVMVSSCNLQGTQGFSIYNVKTGALIKTVAVAGAPGGIETAFALGPNEIYVGASGTPAKIMRVDSTGKVLKTITLTGLNDNVRIIRPTPKKTFLIGTMGNGPLFEYDSTGKVVWQADSAGFPYLGLRLPNGNTLVSCGYGDPDPNSTVTEYAAQMRLVNPQGKVLRRFPPYPTTDTFWTKSAKPMFFSGYQILKNGNIVVSNFPGDDGGVLDGYQILEFDSTGTIVSYWKQDASLIPVGQIHGIIVLDDLDTKVLNSDVNGVLGPIGGTVTIAPGVVPAAARLDFPRLVPHGGLFDVKGCIRGEVERTAVSGIYIREAGEGIDNRVSVPRTVISR